MNGLSGAGKSMWVQTLLKNKYFTQPAEMVYLCLPKNQSHLFKEMINEYKQGNITIFTTITAPAWNFQDQVNKLHLAPLEF